MNCWRPARVGIWETGKYRLFILSAFQPANAPPTIRTPPAAKLTGSQKHILYSLSWVGVVNSDEDYARSRRPVFGPRRSRDRTAAAAYRRCRSRVGQPGLRLDDCYVRSG